ncbi:zinc ribbon domain-containing protein [Mitsuokella multacida]|uniref:zinc ribbon domain-containing protein n=1 Tax=Mitsuokella multacida TaxID=52226 RepID=UPI001F377775|nr:zinc ribbon domain-containing protein [Mitsuokella multacida]MCF2585351.1 zinc-ribbon domain-containing protein [Mitsuokella multacida]
MFCTNCGKELSPEENFCTRCGHKAPVLASQSSDSIDAQKELTTAQNMMAAVNLPDLQAVYAHLDKAAKCQDQALLQQLKALADKYADIANLSKNLAMATAQTVSMNPYLKTAAVGVVGTGIGTMAAGAMNGSAGVATAEAASSTSSSILSSNVGAQLTDHFIRDNHDTLSEAVNDITDTASDTIGDVVDFLSDIL